MCECDIIPPCQIESWITLYYWQHIKYMWYECNVMYCVCIFCLHVGIFPSRATIVMAWRWVWDDAWWLGENHLHDDKKNKQVSDVLMKQEINTWQQAKHSQEVASHHIAYTHEIATWSHKSTHYPSYTTINSHLSTTYGTVALIDMTDRSPQPIHMKLIKTNSWTQIFVQWTHFQILHETTS